MNSSTARMEPQQVAEVVACNLCGRVQVDVVFEAGVAQINQIVRCRHCGLMFASPRHRLVDSADYGRHAPEGLLLGVGSEPGHPWRWRYDKERFQRKDYDGVKRFVNSRYPQRGRLVEVGCSMGQLLEDFRADGWQVQGVDPWKEAALFTEREVGIPCLPTTLEDAKLESNSFDVLVMLHVIEHVADPTATLGEILRLLKPGGYAVIETPRYDSFMFRLFGRHERSVSCDGHIYFFTSDTLERLLKKAGFEIIQREFNGRSLSIHRSIWNLAVMTKIKGLPEIVARVGHGLGLDRIRFYLNLRDMQRVIVRKAKHSLGQQQAGSRELDH